MLIRVKSLLISYSSTSPFTASPRHCPARDLRSAERNLLHVPRHRPLADSKAEWGYRFFFIKLLFPYERRVVHYVHFTINNKGADMSSAPSFQNYWIRHCHRLNRCGRRVFVIAGPSSWNCLLDPVRNPNSSEAAFMRLLKTFFVNTVLAPSTAWGGRVRW